jgi:hypothetical protein
VRFKIYEQIAKSPGKPAGTGNQINENRGPNNDVIEFHEFQFDYTCFENEWLSC